MGVGWIETDIQQLADDELVIFHDEVLGRTTGDHGDIREMAWPAVSALDVGSWKGPEFAGERPLSRRGSDSLAGRSARPPGHILGDKV